jgi:hypothetical protein
MWVSLAGSAAAQQMAAAGAANPPPVATPVAGTFPGVPTDGAMPSATTAPAPAGRTARNSLFLELGGNGGIYTVNYDRVVNERFSVRAGVGYMSIGATVTSSNGSQGSASVSMLAIPLMANFMLGNDNHKLELGGGLTLFYLSGSSSSSGNFVSGSGFAPIGSLVAGYRYVPQDGGFTFRVGFTPLISTEDFVPWGGISFGYLF